MNSLRSRPALGLAVIAVVILAAAVGVLAAVGGGGGGQEAASSTSTSSSGGATSSSSETSSTTPSPTTVTTRTTTTGDGPAAPWRAAAVARSAVPAPYVTAWDRARNHTTCALLFPLDGGPEMPGAKPTEDKTPNDNGWDIFLSSGAASIEVLGLFDKATMVDKTSDSGLFTRTWLDGSVAKYSADVGGAAPGTFDPNTSPFEAVLTLPDQACAYRLYDTLGKDHLEFLFDRLRLMAN
ncbi:MAG TPA: hypothetical protein VGR20_07495 [Acidimicrobiia bacterium]|nr:hypothetical protein [Acidimicrobiia bacterium]